MKNILVVVAHPDDEILGAGGTIAQLTKRGHHVALCVLSAEIGARAHRPTLAVIGTAMEAVNRILGITDLMLYDFRNIHFNTVPHLEMVQAIEAAILRFEPEWIFTHHMGDLNVDHRACFHATMAAAMLPQRLTTKLPVTLIKKIMLFEVPSSTEWAPIPYAPFQPTLFVDIAGAFQTKILALEQYPGVILPFPHPRSLDNLQALAQLRGAQVGLAMAEAFMVVREVLEVEER